MGYRPAPPAPACPSCGRWAPAVQYCTVDVGNGKAVRAVRCECGRTFDRDAAPPLPRITDAGQAFDEPRTVLDHISAMARPVGGTSWR